MSERVLIDTSAFYALFYATDVFHDRARSAYELLTDREYELWTTSYTLVETIALLHRRMNFEVVSKFTEWRSSNLGVLWIDSRVHDSAWVNAQGRGLSFVDWTTVVASREIDDALVFTFDAGFANEGLPVVPRHVR